MTEGEKSFEREPLPRSVTGLFRLQMGGVGLQLSPEGKALPAGGEPRFAVKDIMVAHSTKGWAEFAEKLAVRLTGVESELYRGSRLYSVSEGPWPTLTDDMESGEIRAVTDDEYAEAYIGRYGNVIQGPMFL